MVKISFITQGCSANFADTEVMAGILQEEGYEIIKEIELADLVIYNTCTVKGPTENFFKKKLKKLNEMKKPVVIAGCIPQAMSVKELAPYKNFSIIGTYQIKNIKGVVDKTLEA